MKRHLLKTYGYVIDTIASQISDLLSDLEDGRQAIMWQSDHEQQDEIVIKNALNAIGEKIQAIGADLAMLDELHRQTAPKLIEQPKAIIYEITADNEEPPKATRKKAQ